MQLPVYTHPLGLPVDGSVHMAILRPWLRPDQPYSNNGFNTNDYTYENQQAIVGYVGHWNHGVVPPQTAYVIGSEGVEEIPMPEGWVLVAGSLGVPVPE